MSRDELLDRLYLARRELTRLIVFTAPRHDEVERLERLVYERDQLVWQINRINQSELTASLAEVGRAVDAIDAAVGRLRVLAATAANIEKASSITGAILEVAGGLASKL